MRLMAQAEIPQGTLSPRVITKPNAFGHSPLKIPIGNLVMQAGTVLLTFNHIKWMLCCVRAHVDESSF